MKPKYQRPIYKQIISGICFGISFSIILGICAMVLIPLIELWRTPLGNILAVLIISLMIIPLFITAFKWSLE